MGVTFAEAERMAEVEREDSPLVQYFLTGLRSGRFVIVGGPIEMSPSHYFRNTRLEVVQLYAFRLMTTDPPDYAINFASFHGNSLGFMDFSLLFRKAHQYLVQACQEDCDGRLTIPAPIEGALITYDPDSNDDYVDYGAIGLFPPNMNPTGFHGCLHESLSQCLEKGFGKVQS